MVTRQKLDRQNSDLAFVHGSGFDGPGFDGVRVRVRDVRVRVRVWVRVRVKVLTVRVSTVMILTVRVLTLLVGWQEGHPACKKYGVMRCCLSGARCK